MAWDDRNSLIRSETNPLVRLRPSWVSAKKMPQNFDAGFLKNYGESAAQRFRPRMPRCSTSCRASKPKHLINVTMPTIYSRSSCLTKYFSLKTNHGITYTTLVFDNIAKLHTSRQLNGRLWLEIKLFFRITVTNTSETCHSAAVSTGGTICDQ